MSPSPETGPSTCQRRPGTARAARRQFRAHATVATPAEDHDDVLARFA